MFFNSIKKKADAAGVIDLGEIKARSIPENARWSWVTVHLPDCKGKLRKGKNIKNGEIVAWCSECCCRVPEYPFDKR